jgi:DNA-binding NarL/FixJ family response regulator
MSEPLRIAIADDHALFRQGLKALLKLERLGTVVAEAERAEDIERMLAGTPCDILLLDLQLDRNTLADVARLSARVKVIVVTASERTEDALFAMRSGARGMVPKHAAFEHLVDALRAVAAEQVWMPPALQVEVMADLRGKPGATLTAREREVVRHVALGLRNAEVARRLEISEDTVKKHLNNIFQKLGVRDRVELTHRALRLGLVGINERPP